MGKAMAAAEISVGREYCFITMDTRGYETVDQLWINCLCAT